LAGASSPHPYNGVTGIGSTGGAGVWAYWVDEHLAGNDP